MQYNVILWLWKWQFVDEKIFFYIFLVSAVGYNRLIVYVLEQK